MCADSAQDRRDYVRVAGHILFSMRRIIDAADRERAEAEVLSEAGEKHMIAEPDLSPFERHMLSAINQLTLAVDGLSRKIDTIQTGASGSRAGASERVRLPIRDISGGGFSFCTGEPPESGEHYLVEIELSRFPHVTVHCIAEVRWVKTIHTTAPDEVATTASHEAGMAFTHIRETDRDRIIHTVFRIQREMLRARRYGD